MPFSFLPLTMVGNWGDVDVAGRKGEKDGIVCIIQIIKLRPTRLPHHKAEQLQGWGCNRNEGSGVQTKEEQPPQFRATASSSWFPSGWVDP